MLFHDKHTQKIRKGREFPQSEKGHIKTSDLQVKDWKLPFYIRNKTKKPALITSIKHGTGGLSQGQKEIKVSI